MQIQRSFSAPPLASSLPKFGIRKPDHDEFEPGSRYQSGAHYTPQELRWLAGLDDVETTEKLDGYKAAEGK